MKERLHALGSIRFFLIFYIVVAHFIQVATKNHQILLLLKQHNVIVGAFFVLSGYILTYAYSDQEGISPKLSDIKGFILGRILRVYFPHLAVLLIFGAMFIAIDQHYGSLWITVRNFLLSVTLTQAWFPKLAMVWNPPSWFLSALVPMYIFFPQILRIMITLRRQALVKAFFSILLAMLILKGIYIFYEGHPVHEGLFDPRTTFFYDFLRFSPLINLMEFILGMFACRIAIQHDRMNLPATFITVLLIIGTIFYSLIFPLSDHLLRSGMIIPLFTVLFIQLHKMPHSLTSRILSHRVFIYLGNISFALFLTHGPIGQIFYKKVILKMLFATSTPFMPFIGYLALSICFASLFYHYVELPLGKRVVSFMRSRT